MKYLFTSLISAGLLLTSCTSCHKKDASNDACNDPSCVQAHDSTLVDSGVVSSDAATDVVLDSNPVLTFNNKTWQVTVPSTWEEVSAVGDGSTDSSVELAVVNREEKIMVSLMKEPFEGDINAYLLQSVRGLKDTKATLLENKQVEINGKKMFYLSSSKDKINMWMWVTTHNKFGYVLSCGTSNTFSSSEKKCFEIASSLKFN